MAIRINTNSAATFSTRVLGQNRAKANQAQEHLASGSRIVRSADDAAGLSISERTRAAARSLAMASRNLKDGNALITTAEGALSQIGDILIRLRGLAIQGATDTLSDTERGMIDKEVQQLKEEIHRISTDTQFNGVKLLDGSAATLDIQADANSESSLSRITLHPQEFQAGLERLRIAGISVRAKTEAQDSIEHLDYAQNQIADSRTTLGAIQRKLEATEHNVSTSRMSKLSTGSRIKDADFAEEATELAKHSIIMNANAAMLIQANQANGQALKLLS